MCLSDSLGAASLFIRAWDQDSNALVCSDSIPFWLKDLKINLRLPLCAVSASMGEHGAPGWFPSHGTQSPSPSEGIKLNLCGNGFGS